MSNKEQKLYNDILNHYYYGILEPEFKNFDSLYEDYIVHLIGVSGLDRMVSEGYLESCGVVNGRKLYTLLKKDGVVL